MPDDGSQQSNTIWPMPKFYFDVKWDSFVASFQEVSGLDMETQPIEYRSGGTPTFSTVKMPGIKKYGNVTLKKCLFKTDTNFWDWYKQIKSGTNRQTVTISLLDESGKPRMVWSLDNAYPAKVTSTDLKADGNEVAIETIEIAHEGISIIDPDK